METPDTIGNRTQQPTYDGAEVDDVLSGELALLAPEGQPLKAAKPATANKPAAKPAARPQSAAKLTAQQRLEQLDGKLDDSETEADSDTETEEVESDEGAAEDEEATEQEDDEDEDETPEETVRNPKALIARIAKVKDQRNAARAALAEKDTEITTLRTQFEAVATASIRHEPTAEEPLGDIATEQELDKTEAYWKQELKWCRDNKTGGTRKTADGGTKELDEDEVSARMDRALEVIQHAPARRRLIDAQKKDVQQAAAVFPFFAQNHALHADFVAYADGLLYTGTGESRRLREQIASLPDYASRLADSYLGKVAREGKYSVVPMPDGKVKLVPMTKAEPGAKKPAPAKPPVNLRTGNPPARKGTGRPSLQEAAASGDADQTLDAELGW